MSNVNDKLEYGSQTYQGDGIMSASAVLADSLTMESLSADTLTAVVRDTRLQTRLLAADGRFVVAQGFGGVGIVGVARTFLTAKGDRYGLNRYNYGDVVRYYHDDTLITKQYVENITRTGREQWKFSCISGIGLLLSSYHYGGIYTGETLAELVADIIHGIIPYTLDAELGATPMYGWLPKATRRDNLRNVLFAVGGLCQKDSNGDLSIVPSEADEPYDLDPSAVYMGGSVAGLSPASQVNITEHAYIALDTDETVTLFDGEAAAEPMTTPQGQELTAVLVEFDEPVHNLEVTNGTILESGANYAVLGQSSQCTLTGQRYSHTQRIISRTQTTNAAPNVVQSNACGLVNLLNSENVADRVMAYYGHSKEVETDVVVTNQRPGDAVEFYDPFGDPTSGYIASLDMTMSAICKARAVIVNGYIPSASGNYYTNVAVITATGPWTAPAGVHGKARFVLIGGGDGGEIGNRGERAESEPELRGPAGEGGLPGTPGKGGKILVVTANISPGQVFQAKIGTGGAGSSYTYHAESLNSGEYDVIDEILPAQPGGDTTIGPYSSANGYQSDVGYVPIIGGNVYATPGLQGIPGGRGASADDPGENVVWDGVTYVPGAQGETREGDAGTAHGGYGGGPAAGSNGYDGGRGQSANSDDFISGGCGGNGGRATIKPPVPSIRGSGGTSGHGGGGGGGWGMPRNVWGEVYGTATGYGGLGGFGGDGADGIILVYY